MVLDVCNDINPNGMITGGFVQGAGLDIQWQEGPLDDDGPNGTFVDDVLYAALQRLEAYQDTRLSCRENDMAITKIQEALHWLGARRRDRQDRGVQNTYQP